MADGLIRRWVRVIFDRDAAKKAEGQLAGSMRESGKKAGTVFVKELRAAFAKRQADLKVDLAKGLIKPEEFKKQTALAAQAFNTGVLKLMEDARKAGTLTDTEYKKLARTLKRTGDEGASAWERIKGGIVKAGAALASFFALRRLISFGRDLIRSAEEQERSNRNLANQLANVGVNYRMVEREIRRTARALWDTHRLTGGEVNDIISRLILVTGDYATSIQNVGLVADMAASFQMDWATAAKLVGRVLQGDTGALKRYGINVKDAGEAMRILTERTRGAAKENTTATQTLSRAWGEFKEEFGRVLLDASRGRSIFDRLTGAIISLTDHARELLDLMVAFGKALLVAGAVAGVARLATALVTATTAARGFLAVMRSGLALIGPKGWLVLGIAALTDAFYRMGDAARQAAEDAAKALDIYRDALTEAKKEDLEREAAAIARRKAIVEAALAEAKAVQFGRGRDRDFAKEVENKKTIAGLQANLNQLLNEENAIREEQARRARIPPPPPPGDDDDPKQRADSLSAEINALIQLAETGRATAADLLRLDEIEKQLAETAFAGTAIHRAETQALLEKVKAANLFNLPPKMAGPGLTDARRPLAPAPDVVPEAERQAEAAFSPWLEGVKLIEEEVKKKHGLFFELGQAWADGGFRGLAELAKHKVKENLAAVVENLARAAASYGLGNVGSAKLFLDAAALHGTAAGAWGALAATGGGGSGASGGAGLGTGGPDTSTAAQAQPAAEIHVHFEGAGFDATNPRVQRVVLGAVEQARERYGDNVKVMVHRRP